MSTSKQVAHEYGIDACLLVKTRAARKAQMRTVDAVLKEPTLDNDCACRIGMFVGKRKKQALSGRVERIFIYRKDDFG